MSLSCFRRLALLRITLFAAVVGLQLAGGAWADWSDNFTGNVAHNPPDGAWGYFGLSLPAGQEISGWTPVYASDRVNVRPPAQGGAALYLAAGYVGSTGTQHQYGDVRVAGLVGVNDNGGAGNNNLVGLIARAADFDSYVLAIDHRTQTANLIKSLDATPTTPFTMLSQPIFGYLPGMDFYLQLDVQNVAGGARLVGKVYDDTRSVLLNTLIAVDDDGNAVPGPVHPAYYSGWVAQYNAAAATPTFVDAFFDDVSSKTLRPGDVNLSGTVNRADVALLAANFGKSTNATWDDGDVDGNGRVDLADAMAIQRRLSSGAVIVPPPIDIVADAAAVPEPSGATIVLQLGVAVGAALAARRRSRPFSPRS